MGLSIAHPYTSEMKENYEDHLFDPDGWFSSAIRFTIVANNIWAGDCDVSRLDRARNSRITNLMYTLGMAED